MYCIYADDVCIYNDAFALDNMKVISPKLTLSDSAAGSLSMTLPPTNVGYDRITLLVTDISVTKDGDEIWSGRAISEDKDFWNNRELFCEGDLAFFNDSTQPQEEYHDLTVRGFLETLVNIHNSKVAANRQFKVGVVTVTDSNDSLYRYTNYEKTMECINEKLVDRLGGHLRTRKVDGVRYLDYLADYPNTNSQTIEFGKNLMDFTRSWDMTDFATVILPLGNRLDESPIEALDAYLTVESVNDGSLYVQSANAVSEYGWIEKVVNWDDVSTADALLKKAKAYLSEIQFDDMDIELSALDLHYLSVDYEAVKLLDEIRVVSKPHGMDRLFPVTKLEIPLDEPENTQFTLGDTVKSTLTSVNNETNSAILRKIENLPKESSMLKEAKANATALLNMATNGYITITQDENGTNELYVTNTQDYTKATKLWKWNLNGLGYSKDSGETFGLAITMDGAIVADYITAGVFNGDLIKAGTVKAEALSVEYKTSVTESVTNAQSTAISTAKTNTTNALKSYYTKTEVDNKITVSEEGITASVSKTYVTQSTYETGISNAQSTAISTAKTNTTNALKSYSTTTEMNAAIKLKTDAITTEVNKKVGTSDLGTLIEQNYSHVKIAWNNNSKYIQFESGGISLYEYDSSSEKSSKRAVFNYTGEHFYRDGYYVGKIGTNEWVDNDAHKGLVFDLEYQGKYMAFAQRSSSSSSTYNTVLCFSRANSIYDDYGLHLGCNLDMHGYTLKNVTFEDGGITGVLNFVQVKQMNSDGTANLWSNGCSLTFKNGLLTAGTWNS